LKLNEGSQDMKMTGLILAQSALVGVAVGVYDAGIWLPAGSAGDSWVNGMTYSMGALAVQTIAYYFFKMFFEQQMQERVQMAELQNQRSRTMRQQQMSFDQRRAELEMRMQEAQLENELRWMAENPDKVSPSFNSGGFSGLATDYHSSFNPGIPQHEAKSDQPLELGLNSMADKLVEDDIPRKKDGSPDLRYKAKRGGN
jgi:hypothetical protein